MDRRCNVPPLDKAARAPPANPGAFKRATRRSTVTEATVGSAEHANRGRAANGIAAVKARCRQADLSVGRDGNIAVGLLPEESRDGFAGQAAIITLAHTNGARRAPSSLVRNRNPQRSAPVDAV